MRATTISIIYFIVLLAVLIIFGYTPTNDGEGYIEYARVCIEKGEPYPCMALMKGAPFIWNIGAINLTTLSLYLFNSLWPLLIMMCAMKAVTVWLIGKITETLFSARVATIAMLLYVLYPNNLGQSTTILSEIPMICLALTALYIALRKKSVWWMIAAGVIFGLANWFRPVAITFIGSLLLYYVFFIKKGWLQRSAALCCGYVLFTLVVGTECYHRTGHFVYQAESLWFNMAEATYETSVAPRYDTDPYPVGTARYIENMEEKTAMECNEIWRERSMEWLKAHPWEYLKKVPGRLMYMYYNDMDNLPAFRLEKDAPEKNFILLPYRNMAREITSLSPVQYLALGNMAYYFCLLGLAVCGGVILLRRREYQRLFLPTMIVIGGSLALVLAVHGETRFKAPFMPFIFMMAAVAVASYMKRKGEGR